jgi:lipoprotein-releasing system permease protein
MRLLLYIALRHLLARKRQSVVSLLGIVLGVAFFLAIAGLMQGSENDFIKRLVDNSPHITIEAQYRNPQLQPAEQHYQGGAVAIRHLKPVTETRGIRGYPQILAYLRTIPGTQASPVLSSQALVNFAGQDIGVSLNGIIPSEITSVTTLESYMEQGSIAAISSNLDGVVVGAELVRRMSLRMGENIALATANGQRKTFKIVGIFRTGRASYDETQVYVDLKRVQVLLKRPNRVNTLIVKLDNPQTARAVATLVERHIGYKSVSWQESSEDLMNTLAIRNIIMYTVVSAVLVVAAFGIYNVISTIVMEKQRDISILKAMGFRAYEVERIFLIQGGVLGLLGCLAGLPFGAALMLGLMQISFKPPGVSQAIQLPIDWGWPQFAIAATFAMGAAVIAALLPARKAARVQPVDILRGGF